MKGLKHMPSSSHVQLRPWTPKQSQNFGTEAVRENVAAPEAVEQLPSMYGTTNSTIHGLESICIERYFRTCPSNVDCWQKTHDVGATNAFHTPIADKMSA